MRACLHKRICVQWNSCDFGLQPQRGVCDSFPIQGRASKSTSTTPAKTWAWLKTQVVCFGAKRVCGIIKTDSSNMKERTKTQTKFDRHSIRKCNSETDEWRLRSNHLTGFTKKTCILKKMEGKIRGASTTCSKLYYITKNGKKSNTTRTKKRPTFQFLRIQETLTISALVKNW